MSLVLLQIDQGERIQKFSTEPTMPCNQYSAAWVYFCAISTGAIDSVLGILVLKVFLPDISCNV